MTLTLNEILHSLKAWNTIRNPQTGIGAEGLEQIFSQGNMFTFQIVNPELVKSFPSLTLPKSELPEYIHAYPGYYEGNMIFVLISSQFDNESTYLLPYDGILEYITISPVETALNILSDSETDHQISKQEAEARINDWNNNYPKWIRQALASSHGIYQVMNIPASDIINGDQHSAHFSLTNQEVNSETIYQPDLVLENLDHAGHSTYDDTVCPVPPFGTDFNDATCFYLLSQALLS